MTRHIEELLAASERRTLLRISTAGSVDDGKSTLIGRLLHDSKSVYEDHLAGIRGKSKHVGATELDLSLLTDGLKAEREQGITIDVAYRYFSTPKRHFILADTPGHVQYTRNMATGASTSALAILVVDARNGVTEQTKRHAFISALLGVPRIVVAVNKMDLVAWEESAFQRTRDDFVSFAEKLGVREIAFIPVSALQGDNVVEKSRNLAWYRGPTLLAHLEETYVESDTNRVDFRFPVQYVTRPNQNFRGFAGQIVSGSVRVGDEVVVLPSQKKSRIKSIETYAGSLEIGTAPQSLLLTLTEELDVSRGDLIARVNNVPDIKREFDAILIWMDDRSAAVKGKSYRLLHGNRDVKAKVTNFRYRIDVNDLSRGSDAPLELNEIGRVSIECHVPLFVDSYTNNRATGGFVLIDETSNATVAAGMILDRNTVDSLPGLGAPSLTSRTGGSAAISAEKYGISRDERMQRSGHGAVTIWFTGLSGAGKSTLARELERLLFNQGAGCVLLDGDRLREGLNKDLGFSHADRRENIRRTAELAHLMNSAGIVTICALISPLERDRELAQQIVGPKNFIEIYVSTPLKTCEARDIKGLYKRARAGALKDFTGVDSPYEPPQAADLTIAADSDSVAECGRRLLDFVRDRIWGRNG